LRLQRSRQEIFELTLKIQKPSFLKNFKQKIEKKFYF
jgi:hypothetical protein